MDRDLNITSHPEQRFAINNILVYQYHPSPMLTMNSHWKLLLDMYEEAFYKNVLSLSLVNAEKSDTPEHWKRCMMIQHNNTLI